MTSANLEKRAQLLEEDERQLQAELEAHDARKLELRGQLKQVQAAIRALRGNAREEAKALATRDVISFVTDQLVAAGGQLSVAELKTRFRDHAKAETGSARGSHKRIESALEDPGFEIVGDDARVVQTQPETLQPRLAPRSRP